MAPLSSSRGRVNQLPEITTTPRAEKAARNSIEQSEPAERRPHAQTERFVAGVKLVGGAQFKGRPSSVENDIRCPSCDRLRSQLKRVQRERDKVAEQLERARNALASSDQRRGQLQDDVSQLKEAISKQDEEASEAKRREEHLREQADSAREAENRERGERKRLESLLLKWQEWRKSIEAQCRQPPVGTRGVAIQVEATPEDTERGEPHATRENEATGEADEEEAFPCGSWSPSFQQEEPVFKADEGIQVETDQGFDSDSHHVSVNITVEERQPGITLSIVPAELQPEVESLEQQVKSLRKEKADAIETSEHEKSLREDAERRLQEAEKAKESAEKKAAEERDRRSGAENARKELKEASDKEKRTLEESLRRSRRETEEESAARAKWQRAAEDASSQTATAKRNQANERQAREEAENWLSQERQRLREEENARKEAEERANDLERRLREADRKTVERSVSVCIVAPTIRIGGLEMKVRSVPDRERLQNCLRDEVLPRFSSLFVADDNRSSESEWARETVDALARAIEQRVDDVIARQHGSAGDGD